MGVTSGTPLFTFHISHGRGKGTQLYVKTDPMIEEFIRGLGDGSTTAFPVGYAFFPIEPETPQVYRVGNGELKLPEFSEFALGNWRSGFLLDDEKTVNLTFLQIKGVSEGIRIGVRSVLSVTGMEELKVRLGRACRALCRDYIVPVTMKIVIVPESIERG